MLCVHISCPQSGDNLFLPNIYLSCISFYCLDAVGQDAKHVRNESEVQGLSDGRGRFVPNEKVLELRNRLIKFMEDHIYPMETEFYKLAHSTSRWTVHPEEERLKEVAKKEGLWNLWIPVYSLSSSS